MVSVEVLIVCMLLYYESDDKRENAETELADFRVSPPSKTKTKPEYITTISAVPFDLLPEIDCTTNVQSFLSCTEM